MMRGLATALVLVAVGCTTSSAATSSSVSGGATSGGGTSGGTSSGGATSSGGTTTGGADCKPACGSNEACVAGACQCRAGYETCPSKDGGILCITESADNLNCGACGNTCPTPLTTCGGGKCLCADSSETYCVSDAGAAVCTDVTGDGRNCGSCGKVCTPFLLQCVSSSCVCMQPSDTICTSDAGVQSCANTMTDAENCGQCGHACPPALSCVNGACGCKNAESACAPDGGPPDGGDAFCAATGSDPQNCGVCGQDCETNVAIGSNCRFGNCECPEFTACANVPSGSPPACTCASEGTICASPSFATDIYPLLAQTRGSFGCSASGCHSGAKPAGGLSFLDEAGNMDAGMAYAELLGADGGVGSGGVPACDAGLPAGAPSTQCACASRVIAGDPSDSYFLDLIIGNPPAGCSANLGMPLDDAGIWIPLNQCEAQLLRQWIQTGAGS